MKRKVLFKREIGFVVALTVIALVIALLWRFERPRVGMYGDGLSEYIHAKALVKSAASQLAEKERYCYDQDVSDAVEEYMRQYKYDYNENYCNAYDGMTQQEMTCRGYAAVSYELWRACGYDVKIVVAQKNGAFHAWVKVKIDGKYQNIDYSILGQRAKKPDDPTVRGYKEVCEYGTDPFESIHSDITYLTYKGYSL